MFLEIFHWSARYHSKSCHLTYAVASMLFSLTLNTCGVLPVPGISTLASGLPVLPGAPSAVLGQAFPAAQTTVVGRVGRSAPLPPFSTFSFVLKNAPAFSR